MKHVVFLGLLLAVSPAMAEVYKCQGPAGRTIYQEQPCDHSDLKEVGKIKPPPQSSQAERDRMQGVIEKNKSLLETSTEIRNRKASKAREAEAAAAKAEAERSDAQEYDQPAAPHTPMSIRQRGEE